MDGYIGRSPREARRVWPPGRALGDVELLLAEAVRALLPQRASGVLCVSHLLHTLFLALPPLFPHTLPKAVLYTFKQHPLSYRHKLGNEKKTRKKSRIEES
jgi:hypothetical protein